MEEIISKSNPGAGKGKSCQIEMPEDNNLLKKFYGKKFRILKREGPFPATGLFRYTLEDQTNGRSQYREVIPQKIPSGCEVEFVAGEEGRLIWSLE